MENSNLNLQISDSQVVGSSGSLSLPSEPPDIRNWFSSYEYESPVLDSNDNFEDSVSKESEFAKNEVVIEESDGEEEENPGGFREIRKRHEGLGGEMHYSNGFVKCNSSFGDSKFENQSLSKIPDSLYSPSIVSEPPDIRNWFSSYVYESPVLDTSDGFGDSLSKESECEKDEFAIEDSHRGKERTLQEFKKTRNRDEVDVGEKLCSNGFVKYNSSSGKNKQEKQSSIKNKDDNRVGGCKNLSAQNDLPFERTSVQSLKDETVEKHGISPTKDITSFNNDGSQNRLEQNFPGKSSCTQLNNISGSSGNNDSKSLKQFIYRRDSIHENSELKVQTEEVDCVSPQSKLKLNQVNGISIRKSTHGRNSKENEGKDASENGFVTTRKSSFRRENDGSSLRMPEEMNKGTAPIAGQKDAVIKRKVLAETTNFQRADAMELTGKWRCPQRSKPNLGPPLKQLRLERWVHRV